MQRRRLGGLEVSAVGLGCATMTPFYVAPDPASTIATIRRARDLGVDFLDTSDAYGAGRNEELIARAVTGHRGDYVIASKFGNVQLQGGPRFADGRPEYVKECCDNSLQRLRTDVIDLYFIHRVDADVPIEDTVGAMAELVRAGKVRALGICEAGPATIRRAHAVHPLSAVQIEYSLWTRDVEAEVLPLCQELGIGFIAYSPLGRGFLTGGVTSLDRLRDGDARRRMPRFQGANLARNLGLVEELKAHAAAERCTRRSWRSPGCCLGARSSCRSPAPAMSIGSRKTPPRRSCGSRPTPTTPSNTSSRPAPPPAPATRRATSNA